MTTWPKTKLEVLRDNTGCRHDVREIEGVYQCAWCSRMFTVIGEHIPRLQVVGPREEPRIQPISCFREGTAPAHVAVPVSDAGKIDQVRAMLTDLEAERATKGAARKLRSILGDG